jgi:chromate transporter
VALSQALPGPASSQFVIAVGILRAGLAGGLAAWIGFTLPSALLMLGFAGLLGIGVVAETGRLVAGLQLAAVAVVGQAVLAMARTLTPDLTRLALAAIAAVVVLGVGGPVSQLLVIAGGAVAGLLLLRPDPLPTGESHLRAPVGARVAAAALALFGALLVGLPLAVAAGAGQAVALAEAFYRSGALVFGGGHVVLPLLEATVVEPGWVDPDTFVAGYGAAQALPGPLFAFSAFLGAVAIPEPDGLPGGLLALVAMFIPGGLLVVAALPAWDRLRALDGARTAVAGIGAAVVGILAVALWDPVIRTAIGDPLDAAVAVAGFILLLTGRVPPIVVVGLCAAAGLVTSGA